MDPEPLPERQLLSRQARRPVASLRDERCPLSCYDYAERFKIGHYYCLWPTLTPCGERACVVQRVSYGVRCIVVARCEMLADGTGVR